MSYSVWDAIIRSHRLCVLNNRHLFLSVLEVGKFEIRAQGDLAYGEDSLPSFQMAVFVLYPYM